MSNELYVGFLYPLALWGACMSGMLILVGLWMWYHEELLDAIERFGQWYDELLIQIADMILGKHTKQL